MALIDRRILIAAPVEEVWKIISDHHTLPKWRTDCKAVSMLSTKIEGVGSRRRITPHQGKDVIEEITVWYIKLGYEYQVVDSAAYKTFSARLRLQTTPEGTIMQWTILFQLRGILARLWSGRRRLRQITLLTEDSLRRLRRYVEENTSTIDSSYKERAGIRPGPSSEARLEYGAKLVAQEKEKKSTKQQSLTLPKVINIDEPPVKPEDTPAIQTVRPPSFIVEELTPPPTPIASPPKPTIEEPPVAPEDTKPSRLTEEKSASTPLSTPNSAITQFSAATTVQPAPNAPVSRPAEDVDATPSRPHLPSPTAKGDTGEISIWQVFGVRPPSTTTDSPISPSAEPIETRAKEPPMAKSSAVATEKDTLSSSELEKWLRENEPPLQSGASSTVSVHVRITQPRPPIGMRKSHQHKRFKIRGLRLRSKK